MKSGTEMNLANPFTYGNPVTKPSRFFGRRREVELIFSRLQNPEFESTSIVGERRLGKTSLLYFVSQPEVIRSFGLDPAVYLFIYLDLRIVGPDTHSTRLYQDLLRRIAVRVEDPEIKAQITAIGQQDTISSYDLADAFEATDQSGLYIVLLLDEFENIGSNTKFGSEFYNGLRYLAIHYNLALITASRRDLVEISQLAGVRSSPFFNIFATFDLQPFTRAEMEDLLNHSLQGTGISFSSEDVEHLIELAGLHPHFIQTASWFLFEGKRRQLEGVNLQKFVDLGFLRQAQPQLQVFWQHSGDEEKILLVLLALLDTTEHDTGHSWSADELQQWSGRASNALNKVMRRGLATRTDDAYSLFSTAFSHWVVEEITASSPTLVGSGEPLGTKQPLLPSLPSDMAQRIGDWISKTNPRYRDLFLLWLSDPITAEEAFNLLTTAAAPLREAASVSKPAGQLSGVRLSLVHDDKHARQELRRMLEENEDIEVVGEAENAVEAMNQVESFSPDVILLNAEMPQGEGLEITRILKEQAFAGAVIVVSVDAPAEEIVSTVRRASKEGLVLGASLMKTAEGQELALRYLAAREVPATTGAATGGLTGEHRAEPQTTIETNVVEEETEDTVEPLQYATDQEIAAPIPASRYHSDGR